MADIDELGYTGGGKILQFLT